MSFEYAEEVYRIDPSKIIKNEHAKVYADILLCDSDEHFIIEYSGEKLVIQRQRIVPFVSVEPKHVIVKNQFLDAIQIAKYNTLKRIDDNLYSQENNQIDLDSIEQQSLGLPNPAAFKIRFDKDKVVKYLSEAVKAYTI
ncbi:MULTISPECIES: hypothetical protein [Acinetobacter]|uniref:hypothetical protein n=1 Tax=Acinetobacter TaxID=469 RepID=UPI001022C2AA|nr:MULTISPECIES: hypothetical protein [Acinetobacter]RZH47506.1 hypothetical protein EXD89_05200 [Acinetobacter pittii]